MAKVHLEIKNGNNVLENLARKDSLELLESLAPTSALQKLAELLQKPEAIKKFESKFSMIKKFL